MTSPAPCNREAGIPTDFTVQSIIECPKDMQSEVIKKTKGPFSKNALRDKFFSVLLQRQFLAKDLQ
jgi:hypothetical protein